MRIKRKRKLEGARQRHQPQTCSKRRLPTATPKIQTAKTLPPPGEMPKDDTASVMKFYGLSETFPKAVRDEARRIDSAPSTGEEEVESGRRLDLRGKFIFTCDPVSARDYDDALSFERDRLGRRVLGVHIADVSHYVRQGSAIDKEACKRSTSVYLADRVVPMLPEVLSNGLCSLVPGEDRLAFSVFIAFDKRGEVVKTSFSKSLIRSSARYTYEQVMAVISAGAAKKLAASLLKRIQGGVATPVERRRMKVIREIHELAQQLRAKRFAAGALDLETPDTQITLDSSGEMTGLVTLPYDESHQMVEECMVAANEAVAKELKTHGVKILARYHASPAPDRLLELRQDAQAMGVKCGNLENKAVFRQFMQTIKGHPAYSTLAVLVLRAMNRAVYDADHMGHWGLAKEFYAHFTSPIRRYPDLTLHRQLAAYLDARRSAKPQTAKGRKQSQNAQPSPEELRRWAMHSSEMEQIAAEAERSLLEIKKYRILAAEVESGSRVEYDAVITKCERFGCFVDVPALMVSGLVHISSLSEHYVRYNAGERTLSAPAGGSWRVGDTIRVVAVQVDFDHRRIVFEPADRPHGESKPRTGKSRRGRQKD